MHPLLRLSLSPFPGGENPRDSGRHLSICNLSLPANFARWRRQRHPWKVVLLQSSIVVNVKMVRAETLRMTDYQRQNSGQAEVQRPRVRRGQCCLLKAILDPPLKSKNVYHWVIVQLHFCCYITQVLFKPTMQPSFHSSLENGQQLSYIEIFGEC